PVFNASGNAAGYRPTHDSCLMRDMMSDKFCAPDVENMWVRFLDRVSLIDGVMASGGRVHLQAPALDGLEIRWFRRLGTQETEVTELRGVREWTYGTEDRGDYRVQVHFVTPEV